MVAKNRQAMHGRTICRTKYTFSKDTEHVISWARGTENEVHSSQVFTQG